MAFHKDSQKDWKRGCLSLKVFHSLQQSEALPLGEWPQRPPRDQVRELLKTVSGGNVFQNPGLLCFGKYYERAD